jgi:hypothetical protein
LKEEEVMGLNSTSGRSNLQSRHRKNPINQDKKSQRKKRRERERERSILEFMHRKARKKERARKRERGHGILSCCLLQN